MHWLILGCGYTGTRLAKRLTRAGARVVATTRSTERRDQIEEGVASDRLEVRVLPELTSRTLTGFDWGTLIEPLAVIVHSIPPPTDDGSFELELATEAARLGAHRLIYLSSTGVYGRGGEDWIDEHAPLEPLAARGQRRLSAERALRGVADNTGLSAVSLRVAGIYGPNRGVLARMRRGDYRVYQTNNSWVSRIHVDDLVGAIERAGAASEVTSPAYNIADNDPASSRVFADVVSKLFDLPEAPTVPTDQASPSALAMLAANRRISSKRAQTDLEWTLRYPSWRDGLAAIRAGESSS